MYSRITLAQKWGLSVRKVHEMAEDLNKIYALGVAMKTDHLWHGVMWKRDALGRFDLAVDIAEGHRQKEAAAQQINEAVDTWEMPAARAELLGMPVDAYKLLKKITPRKLAQQINTQKQR